MGSKIWNQNGSKKRNQNWSPRVDFPGPCEPQTVPRLRTKMVPKIRTKIRPREPMFLALVVAFSHPRVPCSRHPRAGTRGFIFPSRDVFVEPLRAHVRGPFPNPAVFVCVLRAQLTAFAHTFLASYRWGACGQIMQHTGQKILKLTNNHQSFKRKKHALLAVIFAFLPSADALET